MLRSLSRGKVFPPKSYPLWQWSQSSYPGYLSSNSLGICPPHLTFACVSSLSFSRSPPSNPSRKVGKLRCFSLLGWILLLLFLLVFIYLAVLGLSCGMQDLQSSLQHEGSLVVEYKLLVAAGGTQFPDQDSALGAQSLSQWTTREVPQIGFLMYNYSNQSFISLACTPVKMPVINRKGKS